MKPYAEMTMEELEGLEKELRAEYKKIQARGLELNMSRGKPCTEQLDLSMGMMDVLSSEMDLLCEDGTDCRNYGVLDGIPEALELIRSCGYTSMAVFDGKEFRDTDIREFR